MDRLELLPTSMVMQCPRALIVWRQKSCPPYSRQAGTTVDVRNFLALKLHYEHSYSPALLFLQQQTHSTHNSRRRTA
jgi:hypothetical protein